MEEHTKKGRSPSPALCSECQPQALPPKPEVYSGSMVLREDLAKMQVLMQWVCGGAWDAAFLTGPRVMLILLVHGSHSEQQGFREHWSPE